MGASTVQVVTLVIRDFIWLIFIGSVMAIPTAYFLTDQWLANFAFTAQIGPGVYVSAVLLVLGAALVTIAGQSARVALDPPVKVLRGW